MFLIGGIHSCEDMNGPDTILNWNLQMSRLQEVSILRSSSVMSHNNELIICVSTLIYLINCSLHVFPISLQVA